MRRLAKSVALLCCLLALGSLLVAVPAGAATPRQAEIEQEKRVLRDKIREADRQAMSLTQQLAASNARRAKLEAELAITARRLKDAEATLASAEAALGEARSQLFGIESQLALNLGKQEKLRAQLEERTRTAYKVGGGGLYLEILLGADDFREFAARLTYVADVIGSDRSNFVAIKQMSEKLGQARTDAIGKRDDITAQKVLIESERANVAALQAELKASRQKVDAEIARENQLLTKVKSDKAGYQRQMVLLEQESRSIAALLRSRQRGQVYQAGTGRKLAWPSTGAMSSSFGYRTHPIFGDRRMHAGIDISAPYGQAVIAAESGTVVFAATRGGYGQAIVIDHGGALATLYAHMSSLGVSTGSSVTRGQRIGSIGCSGYCTGPHLHFETRVSGEPVDPMRFF